MPSFQFEGYILRPAHESDLPMAREWNAADPDHAWELTQDRFWIEQGRRGGTLINSFLLWDEQGPVFFFRAEVPAGARSVEVSIQFNRSDRPTPLWRTMNGMLVGERWLRGMLAKNGIRTIFFNSKSPRLIRFAQHRLEFREVWNEDAESRAAGFRRFRKEF
jgi:hypothetical protein